MILLIVALLGLGFGSCLGFATRLLLHTCATCERKHVEPFSANFRQRIPAPLETPKARGPVHIPKDGYLQKVELNPQPMKDDPAEPTVNYETGEVVHPKAKSYREHLQTAEDKIVTPLANALVKIDRNEPTAADEEHLPARLDPTYMPAPVSVNPDRKGMATIRLGNWRVGIAEQDGTFGENEAEARGKRMIGPDKRTKYYIVDTPEVPVNTIVELNDAEKAQFASAQAQAAAAELRAQADALEWENAPRSLQRSPDEEDALLALMPPDSCPCAACTGVVPDEE
jgi:hypothetical protein